MACRRRGFARSTAANGSVFSSRTTAPHYSTSDCRGRRPTPSRPWGDDHVSSIIGGIMQAFIIAWSPSGAPTVEDLGTRIERYCATGDEGRLTRSGRACTLVFSNLSASQTNRRLLHGDLQHSNILFDQTRGWIAIDPKGVIGEPRSRSARFSETAGRRQSFQRSRCRPTPGSDWSASEAGLRTNRLHWPCLPALAWLSAIWCGRGRRRRSSRQPSADASRALEPAIESAS